MQVPPLSDILRTAAGLGVDVQPDALPASAAFLYQTIYDSLIPDLNLKHEQRHRVALDTAVLLCATHDSERLVPTNVERVGGTLGECFAAYGLPVERRVRHPLRVLAICTRGGVLVPTLKDLANRLRNGRIRRACRDAPTVRPSPVAGRFKYGLHADAQEKVGATHASPLHPARSHCPCTFPELGRGEQRTDGVGWPLSSGGRGHAMTSLAKSWRAV
ncbi:MAG: hypothetical protein OXC69_08370 [Candidatus Tectomicrobia bacterium]|nr:hypothetical protein [Candidatus Tectomicrobia bacterium]